jgi:hypothetical protein
VRGVIHFLGSYLLTFSRIFVAEASGAGGPVIHGTVQYVRYINPTRLSGSHHFQLELKEVPGYAREVLSWSHSFCRNSHSFCRNSHSFYAVSGKLPEEGFRFRSVNRSTLLMNWETALIFLLKK